MKTTRLIGQVCKCGNTFSLLVLMVVRLGHKIICTNSNVYLKNVISKFTEINWFIQFFGGYSEEVTPVPIPNTEVKLFSADGTAGAARWESRTPSKSF